MDLINEEEIYDQVELLKAKAKTHTDRHTIKIVLERLEFLPKYKLNPADINEENLRIKYIDPIFKYFFSHKKHGLVLHYPEKSPDERKLRTDTIKRPDAIVSFYQQSTFTMQLFSKLKPPNTKAEQGY